MKCKLLAIALVLLLALTACNNSNEPKEVTDMSYTAEICGQSFSGIYTGTTVEELPHGTGTFIYESKKEELTYSGQWENGTIVGAGELEYDGYVLEYNEMEYTGIYSGQAENGLPCGTGNFEGEKHDKYLTYEGTWKDGTFSGNGYLEATEFPVDMGDNLIRIGIFKGDVLNGEPSGNGIFVTKNDTNVSYTYDGEWLHGQFNGYGVTTFNHDNYLIKKGNYTNGLFTPTPEQLFSTIGTWQHGQYQLTSSSRQFIKEYEDIFLNNSIDEHNIEVEQKFDYKEFAKNPESFGHKLISVSFSVVQIREDNMEGTKYTHCIGRDGNGKYYYINMLGHADGIYANNWVKATLLPLDYFTYDSVGNTKVWAMAAAAVTITK